MSQLKNTKEEDGGLDPNKPAPNLPSQSTHRLWLIVGVGLLWLMFSGKIVEEHDGVWSPDYVHLFFGVVSTAIVVFLTPHLIVSRYKAAENSFLSRLNWGKALVYPFWLFKEVIKSNIDVAKLLLQPKIEVDPVLVWVPFPVQSSVCLTVLANSITLTPGTFTLTCENGGLLIHSVDASIAEGLVEGSMQRRVAELFGETLPADCTAQIYHTMSDANLARGVA